MSEKVCPLKMIATAASLGKREEYDDLCFQERCAWWDGEVKKCAVSALLQLFDITLNNYENGVTVTPPDVVLKMGEVYKQPTLSARYCSEMCPIGQKYAHSVTERELTGAVLGLLKGIKNVKGVRDDLVDISEDGVIQEHERPVLEEALRELLMLEKAIETLKLWAAQVLPIDALVAELKKEKAPCKAAR